jgi:hypothetical protein
MHPFILGLMGYRSLRARKLQDGPWRVVNTLMGIAILWGQYSERDIEDGMTLRIQAKRYHLGKLLVEKDSGLR